MSIFINTFSNGDCCVQQYVLCSLSSIPFPSVYTERVLPWAITCTAVEYHLQKTYLTSYENVIGGRRMRIWKKAFKKLS